MNNKLQKNFNRTSLDKKKKKKLPDTYFYFLVGSDEVLLKIILEFLIHINAFNRMEINSWS